MYLWTYDWSGPTIVSDVAVVLQSIFILAHSLLLYLACQTFWQQLQAFAKLAIFDLRKETLIEMVFSASVDDFLWKDKFQTMTHACLREAVYTSN